MGSGKSTVGKIVATRANCEFIDLDAYIEKQEGQSIADIFSSKGEVYFRKKELEYLNELLVGKNQFVLATGGGTPCYGNNLKTILSASSNVFYLKLSLNELVNRLAKEKEQRPLIKDTPDADLLEFIGKHLFERSFFYNQAPHVVTTDTKTPDNIAEEVVTLLV